MQNKHEQAYARKGLSDKASFKNDKEKLTQEIAEAENNNLKGQTMYECTVRPMSANGQSAYTIHSSGVHRGLIHGIHDRIMPIDSGSAEQQAIQNGCLPIFNSNSPGQGEPIASNGSRLLMNANNREGVATSGHTRNLRSVGVASPTTGPMIGVGGGGFSIAGGNWGSANSATQIPNNPSSNKVMGKEFIVNGVKYNSLPADDAAVKAQALRDSANAAGQAEYLSGGKGNWDASDEGREWVAQNIYLPVIKKSPSSYADPVAMTNYFASKLGTGQESFWSSWFFRRCYESYWDEDASSRIKGLDSSTVFDYTVDEGIKLRTKIEADPDSFKGQNVFVSFRSTEAPIFVGDAVWNSRANPAVHTIEAAASSPPSHMKVITKDNGSEYRAIGGNEGKFSTVNDVPIKVDSDKMITEKKGYYGVVYKRVTVMGADSSGEALASN